MGALFNNRGDVPRQSPPPTASIAVRRNHLGLRARPGCCWTTCCRSTARGVVVVANIALAVAPGSTSTICGGRKPEYDRWPLRPVQTLQPDVRLRPAAPAGRREAKPLRWRHPGVAATELNARHVPGCNLPAVARFLPADHSTPPNWARCPHCGQPPSPTVRAVSTTGPDGTRVRGCRAGQPASGLVMADRAGTAVEGLQGTDRPPGAGAASGEHQRGRHRRSHRAAEAAWSPASAAGVWCWRPT